MKRKIIAITAIMLVAVIFAAAYILVPGFAYRDKPVNIRPPRPDVEAAYANLDDAKKNGGGWYLVMDENFDGSILDELWHPSPHGKRLTGNWCDNMVRVENGEALVYSMRLTDNNCPVCPAEGDFSGGIETRKIIDGKSAPTFEQAFGYFEARVKIPRDEGLWSAFWLQCNSMGQVGNGGRDGSEIDIYESSFYNDPGKVGNAIHWDGYGFWYRSKGNVADTGRDLYDGYHTYGLLWTPTEYTFYVDGVPHWSAALGGVSRVPEFLRLTVETHRAEWGPYGQKLGEFINTRENPSVFHIDYVRVWQNTEYLPFIQSPDDFKMPFWASFFK
ncbi:MAG: glycoside hydrolase family 16 protein [Oscillospiraceae bacterium]|nr:glycoside hydrolase family 16 protein [Oscillospiraceae bacterium]